MRIKASLITTAVRSLAQSMEVHTMENLANRLIRNYNLNKRAGFPPSVSIPNLDAARQVIQDMKESGLIPQFINLLVEMSTRGWMGKQYDIAYLRDLVREIKELGFIYDSTNRLFVEDPMVRRTRNWGTLREGEDYIFTFLGFDIAGNTALVKKYPRELVDSTFNDFEGIVKHAINKRNGRVWSWEGDGGIIAFYFSSKNQMAVLSAMEILHELFLYNRLSCRLGEPLRVRIAIHSGNCDYTSSEEDLKKLDPVKKTIEYEEKYTRPNTATISGIVHATLDDIITRELTPVNAPENIKLYSYCFTGEKKCG